MPNEKFITGYQFADLQILTYENLNDAVNLAEATPYLINAQTALGAAPATIDEILINDAPTSGAAGNLRKITVSQLFNSGAPITNLESITGKTDVDFSVILSEGKKFIINRDLTVQEDAIINQTLTVNGKTTINNELEVNGNFKVVSTGAMLIPVGTTAQRPTTPILGQVRYNTTLQTSEIYNGTGWVTSGGGNPFDGTGGNFVIGPDAETVSATWTSNGKKVVVTKAGHTIRQGQEIEFTTSVTGYSGRYIADNAFTTSGTFYNTEFWFSLPIPLVANSGTCTYKKIGNFKAHIFTTSGTFTAGPQGGYVEVLVIGGGGGGNEYAGGGGAAAIHIKNYWLDAGEIVYVTVGTGGKGHTQNGTPDGTNGTSSTFKTIVAGGGWAAAGREGGNSGAYDTNAGIFSVWGRGLEGGALLPYTLDVSGFSGGNKSTNGPVGYPNGQTAYWGGGGGGAGGGARMITPFDAYEALYAYPKINGGQGKSFFLDNTIREVGGGGCGHSQQSVDYNGGWATHGAMPKMGVNPNGFRNTGAGGSSKSIWPNGTGGWNYTSGDGADGLIIVRYNK
jgi:hypothetical protein